ncbi:MAG TPA: Mrp/NBP35 family ATP-binding protein [Tepidisphaeraceae bacterium]|jgi:ATP-binding protein involved in chromosome partitioning
MPLTRETATEALRKVLEPELFKDIVTLNLVKEVQVNGDAVTVMVELPQASAAAKDVIERDATHVLREAGAGSVRVMFGLQQTKPMTIGGHPTPSASEKNLPQVKNVIAVGAGKGGVGKSTVAVNLAVGLQRLGHNVGLMDGDIYGPSMPTMLGIRGVAPKIFDNKIVPHYVHGLHAITIGSLVEPEKPLIWRGPMAHGAFKQLLLDNTAWPPLDYLVVDLPPGTGDVPLTLCQLLGITGAVIVATPQQVALDDAIRAVRMFQQLGAPILGLVENMSYFVAADGTQHDIFGRGGTRRAAEELGATFLGELPMFTDLRQNSDSGKPHANFEGPAKPSLEALVTALKERVDFISRKKGPTLEIR